MSVHDFSLSFINTIQLTKEGPLHEFIYLRIL